MNPGDTVRARTQTGMLIEVKIPAGAHPGDVVQFAVPDSWKENEDGMETPTLKAKKVGEEKINVQVSIYTEYTHTPRIPLGIYLH